jgi:hypothetical protein
VKAGKFIFKEGTFCTPVFDVFSAFPIYFMINIGSLSNSKSTFSLILKNCYCSGPLTTALFCEGPPGPPAGPCDEFKLC